ncbi:MAG: hypothetical protein IPK06_18470 [Ignavibacteriae bacterium]|nr:hypothetical protein [Ignavibacteriota bacterium]
MDITEQDLFKYIMYPESLSEDTYKFIFANESKFEKELDFLKQLNADLKKPTEDSTLEKLYKRIEEQNSFGKIILELEEKSGKNSNEECFLAAASIINKDEIKCATFVDKNKSYILKMVTKNSESKFYLFTKNLVQNKIVNITFLPSNKKLSANINEFPIICSWIEVINKVEISFS